jgi:hypothetical protein
MTLKVALQMDPLERINIDADSTFVLALEAQARGYAPAPIPSRCSASSATTSLWASPSCSTCRMSTSC